MTITKRKTNSRDQESRSTHKAGIDYTCDACSADISHTVRIRCAQVNPGSSPGAAGPSLVCENFDLCGRCFCEGKEVARHKKWHDYRIVEQHAFPIFDDEWGADEELLLIDACQTYGLGNWADIAERVGNGRTKEEVAQHYLDTYIRSPDFPLPSHRIEISVSQEEFHLAKKRRIEAVHARPLQPPPPKPLASVPSNHEIGGFMPGRLDFETEWENDAETSIKDLAFGRVYRFGGDTQPERDPDAPDDADIGKEVQDAAGGEPALPTGAAVAMASSKRGVGLGSGVGKVTQRKDEEDEKDRRSTVLKEEEDDDDEDEEPLSSVVNGTGVASAPVSQAPSRSEPPPDSVPAPAPVAPKEKGKEKEEKPAVAAPAGDDDDEGPIGDEDDEDLELKLAILEIYNDRYDRRMLAKQLVFDRNLLEYKKIVAAERKLPKDQRDLIVRIKPFARLQTALDHEKFQDGLLYEMALKKRIQELQEYRRNGITSLAEGERYDKEKQARHAAKQRDFLPAFDRLAARKPRTSSGFDDVGSREGTPGTKVYKRLPPIPLSLSTAESLRLLDPSEVVLCSRLQMLPKPFLYIKELFLREYARRGGNLTREAATRLVPLSAESVGEDGESRLEAIWDFYLGGLETESEDDEGEVEGEGEGEGEDGDEDGEPEASSSDDGGEAEVLASLQGSVQEGSGLYGTGANGMGPPDIDLMMAQIDRAMEDVRSLAASASATAPAQ